MAGGVVWQGGGGGGRGGGIDRSEERSGGGGGGTRRRKERHGEKKLHVITSLQVNARKFAVDGLLLLCMGSRKREKETKKKEHP